MEENRVREVVEFTEEQIRRNDELCGAAYEFMKVVAETDDIPWDCMAIWHLIFEAADTLVESYGRRVRIPSRVTSKDGTKQWMEDWYDKD